MDLLDEEILIRQALLLDEARLHVLNFTLYTKPDYVVNWHHRALCKELDDFALGRTRFLMIFMPPRHGKSELVSRRFPAFLHGLYPDAEMMAASYSDSLASDMTADVQTIMDTQKYLEVFPKTVIPTAGTRDPVFVRNSSEHHIMGRRGKYRGQGVGGSFTGKGARFIIIDDPIKGREAADSLAFRERLWNFYNNDLMSRLETDLTTGALGQVLITQTRWHEDDLAGRILEQAKKNPVANQFKIVNYPAIKIDEDDPTDLRQIGDALWPQKYPLAELEAIKANGARSWSSLYQQSPVPASGGLFEDTMFRFGPVPDIHDSDETKRPDYTFIIGDTAYNDKKENDFTVFTAFSVRRGELYINDVWRKQIKAAEVEKEAAPFIQRHSAYGFRGAYIEPKGHGIYLNQALPKRGIMIPSETTIKEFFDDRKKDKVERANNAVPHLAGRYIVINESIPHKEDLLAEVLGFPKAKHDDFTDTVIDGIKMAFGKKRSILDFCD